MLWKKLHRPGTSDTVMITPESGEDMYALAALVDEGDVVTASTLRKVQRETGGATASSRLLMRLGVEVSSTHLDADAGVLRVAGVVTTEVEHVKLGSHHTLELEPHRPFDLTKPGGWGDSHYAILKEAGAAGGANADVLAVVMEPGVAYVCAVSGPLTTVRAKVAVAVPKKRAGTSGHDKGLERFFDALLAALLRHGDWAAAPAGEAAGGGGGGSKGGAATPAAAAPAASRPIILASPGFLKDDFLAYALEQASSRGLREVTDAASKGRFVTAHASAGNPRALRGVLADASLAARLGGSRAATDAVLLESFLRALHTDPDGAVYGYRHVAAAAAAGAVGTLLIVDGLLRAKEPAVRAGYAALVEEVQHGGGGSGSGGSSSNVHVLAGGHAPGAALAQMGGLAGLLRFPVHDLEEAAAGLPRAPGAGTGAAGGGGGGGGDASSAAGGGGGYDSDASSDSDASYKQQAVAAAAAAASKGGASGGGAGGALPPSTAAGAAASAVARKGRG
jgi:protein pelota